MRRNVWLLTLDVAVVPCPSIEKCNIASPWDLYREIICVDLQTEKIAASYIFTMFQISILAQLEMNEKVGGQIICVETSKAIQRNQRNAFDNNCWDGFALNSSIVCYWPADSDWKQGKFNTEKARSVLENWIAHENCLALWWVQFNS